MIRIIIPLIVSSCAFAAAPEQTAKTEIDQQTNDFISSDLYRSHVGPEFADVDKFVHSSASIGPAVDDESEFFFLEPREHIARIRALFDRVPENPEVLTIASWKGEFKPLINRALYDYHTDVVSRTTSGDSALGNVVKQLHFFVAVFDAQTVDEILQVKAKILRDLDLIMSVRESVRVSGKFGVSGVRTDQQRVTFVSYAEKKVNDIRQTGLEVTDTLRFDTLSSVLAIARGVEFFDPDYDLDGFRFMFSLVLGMESTRPSKFLTISIADQLQASVRALWVEPELITRIEISRITNEFISSDLYRRHVRPKFVDVDRFVHASEYSSSEAAAAEESEFFVNDVAGYIARIRELFDRVPADREVLTIPDWTGKFKPKIHRALYDFHTAVVSRTTIGNSALANVVKQLHFFLTVFDAQTVDEILQVKAKILRDLDLIMSVRDSGSYEVNRRWQLSVLVKYTDDKFKHMFRNRELAQSSPDANETYTFDTVSSFLAIAAGLESFAPAGHFRIILDWIPDLMLQAREVTENRYFVHNADHIVRQLQHMELTNINTLFF